MNDLRTAAQQALAFTMRDFASLRDFEAAKAVLHDNLRAALAQQDESVQEPVAKVELMTTGGNAGLATRIVEIDDHLRERLRPGQLLYTAPPRCPNCASLEAQNTELDAILARLADTERKPLTEEEIERICMTYQSPRQAVRAIERAHGITGDNTGDNT